MTTIELDQVKILIEALNTGIPDQAWLPILETLQVVGVADMLQLQQATGYDRDKARRVLNKVLTLEQTFGTIAKALNQTVARPGQRGRAPTVYRLEEAGAAALRSSGHPGAQACRLSEETALAHALAMLSVHLAARQAGLTVQTDQEISYNNSRHIRPDHVIALPDGASAIFEVEQHATPELLRRIIESLRNKVKFFRSPQGRAIQPEVRMVVNLPRGRHWDKTLTTWQRAVTLLANETHESLPFRLFAIPLGEFLDQPDWNSSIQDSRWIAITTAPTITDAAAETSLSTTSSIHPRQLIQRTLHEDRLVIYALWAWFEEKAAQKPGSHPSPDPEFFELMRLIYAASHNSHAAVLQQAAQPEASIYLLKSYLDMHPGLRAAIQQVMQWNSTSMRWNTTTILHRMQVVMDAFMRYHGWRTDGPVRIWADTCPWDRDEPRTFAVRVSIYNSEVLMSRGEQIVPSQNEVNQAAEALAWVLWALFAYARELGLKYPPFW